MTYAEAHAVATPVEEPEEAADLDQPDPVTLDVL